MPTCQIIDSFAGNKALSEAETLHANWYTSPEIANLEREGLFKKSWQYFCRSEQVAEPGDFVTQNIAGQPVLVTRDKAGKLHAMANVCRHRAARVECRSEGKASRFRCRYHGWAYDLAGNLAGTPDFEGVAHFNKDEHPLPPYHVSVWGPFVFVNLASRPSDFDAFVAPLEKYRGKMRMDDLRFHSRKEWEIECNWKIFVDNYQDGGYHINTLHPELAKVVNMETYDTEMFADATLQLSPLRSAQKGEGKEILNSVRSGENAYYWWLYPNFMMNVYDGVMDINIVQPITESRCKVIFDFYFAGDGMTSDPSYIANSINVSNQVQDEDIDICEEVQRNLATGAFQTGRFSVRREAGGYLFHQLVAKAVKEQSLGN